MNINSLQDTLVEMQKQATDISHLGNANAVLIKNKADNRYQVLLFSSSFKKYLFIAASLFDPYISIFNTKKEYTDSYDLNKKKFIEKLNECDKDSISVQDFYPLLKSEQNIFNIQNTFLKRVGITNFDRPSLTKSEEQMETLGGIVKEHLISLYRTTFKSVQDRYDQCIKERENPVSTAARTKAECTLCQLRIEFLSYYDLLLQSDDTNLIEAVIFSTVPSLTDEIFDVNVRQKELLKKVGIISSAPPFLELQKRIRDEIEGKQEEVKDTQEKLQSFISSDTLDKDSVNNIDQLIVELTDAQKFLSTIQESLQKYEFSNKVILPSLLSSEIINASPDLQKIKRKLQDTYKNVTDNIANSGGKINQISSTIKEQELTKKESIEKLVNVIKKITVADFSQKEPQKDFNELLRYLIKSMNSDSSLMSEEDSEQIAKLCDDLRLNFDKFKNPRQLIFIQDKQFLALLDKQINLLQEVTDKQEPKDSSSLVDAKKAYEIYQTNLANFKKTLNEIKMSLELLQVSDTYSPENISLDEMHEIFVSIKNLSKHVEDPWFYSEAVLRFHGFDSEKIKKQMNFVTTYEPILPGLIKKRDNCVLELYTFLRNTIHAIKDVSKDHRTAYDELIKKATSEKKFIEQQRQEAQKIKVLIEKVDFLLSEPALTA